MTPETICFHCNGTKVMRWDGSLISCGVCGGTGRIPAQGSEADSKTPGIEGIKNSAEAEAEQDGSPTSIPPSAGEGELDRLIASKEWLYDCTAYGEGQQCCVEAGHPNRARLDAYIARRVLEVIGEDEPDPGLTLAIGGISNQPQRERLWTRNELRAEQRQRIAVIKKESQQ